MSNRVGIYFTPKAEEDLERIYKYSYLTWGLEQAERYQDDLYFAINEIEHSPEIGKLYFGKNEVYQTLVVRKHIVYYKQKEDKIIVIRILHGSMDRERWME